MSEYHPSDDDVEFEVTDDAQNISASNDDGGNGDEAQNELIELGPQPGMVFDSRKSLYEAYKHFAKVKGFDIIGRNTQSNKYYMISCDRSRKAVAKRFTKKTDCRAHFNAIKQENGCWKVSSIQPDHNHDLEPSMSVFMAGHRNISQGQKRTLEAIDIAGVRPCKNTRMLEVMAGGSDNLGATTKDCLNFIHQRRRLRLGEGDAEAIHHLFMRLQTKDMNFFHLMDIDDHGRLRNVMWIHPRSIAAYQDFHDVISFDTTYLVNQYKMSLATVVGVNHHYQSILLGCALLTHEHAESFTWFFRNWLLAMGGVHPTAMLNDQCESIKKAVREVMPDTIHRFCLWHISEKMPKKLKVADFQKCSSDFYSMIYDSTCIDEFEMRWGEFLIQYALQNNRWMKDLYEERKSWVPIYLNHFFWAGMVSTQRSESMHAFFDGYVNSRSTLKTFVEQYEIAMSTKIRKEMHADYQSKCVTIKCLSDFKWEEQFSKAYTNNVFQLVQKEIKMLWNCNVREIVPDGESDEGEAQRYEVTESRLVRNLFRKDYTFIVEYRPVGEYVSCNCRKWEFKGILCVHIFKVLSYRRIELVNDRYMMARWRKNVYRPHSSIYFAGGYPHMTDEYKRFQEMERLFHKAADMAYNYPEKREYVNVKSIETINGLMNWNPVVPPSAQNGERSNPNPIIRDPMVSRTRGRPRQLRFQSSTERGRSSRGRGQGRARNADPMG